MTRDQVASLLSGIAAQRTIDSFIVLGSFSVYAVLNTAIPETITVSNEVDGLPEIYLDLAFDFAGTWVKAAIEQDRQ